MHEVARPVYHDSYHIYRQINDQKITHDREPPEWFLRELADQDRCLKVEYWGRPRCEFRLVRVTDDGRWAHVRWFRVCDSSLLRWLRSADTFRGSQDPSSRQAKIEYARSAYLEHEEKEKARSERFQHTKEEALRKATTRDPGRLYSVSR